MNFNYLFDVVELVLGFTSEIAFSEAKSTKMTYF